MLLRTSAHRASPELAPGITQPFRLGSAAAAYLRLIGMKTPTNRGDGMKTTTRIAVGGVLVAAALSLGGVAVANAASQGE